MFSKTKLQRKWLWRFQLCYQSHFFLGKNEEIKGAERLAVARHLAPFACVKPFFQVR